MADSLASAQNWMLTVLTTPGDLDSGLALAQQRYGKSLESTIEDKGVHPALRLNVYSEGYRMRLLECLRADYPALRNLMGEKLFDFFAEAYIRRHPSRSPSLFDLGTGFPGFLHTNAPKEAGSEFTLVLEMATLERARTEVIRAKGTESKKSSTAFTPNPLMAMVLTTDAFKTPPCLRLLTLSHPLIPFLEAVERGKHPAVPEERECFIAITRRNYKVSMYDLEPWQYRSLEGKWEDIPLEKRAKWIMEANMKGLIDASPENA